MTLGRATYEPGWRWSEHVGEGSCQVEHVGLVLSGQAAVKMDDGTEKVMREGEFFYVPRGRDWPNRLIQTRAAPTPPSPGTPPRRTAPRGSGCRRDRTATREARAHCR